MRRRPDDPTRIKELLAAGPDEFTAAIADIDRSLQQRVEAIRHTRHRLGQLVAGDGLFVSPEVARYLKRLQELGVSRRAIHLRSRSARWLVGRD